MKRKKKPGYCTLLASGADSHRKSIAESLGNGTSKLFALVAFQRVDRAIDQLDRLARGGYCPTSAALVRSQFTVHQRKG